MYNKTSELKQFGFNIPKPPSTTLHAYTKGGIIGYQEHSLSYQEMLDRISDYRDALYYISREALNSIKDAQKLGTKVYGDSTAWELVCEIQASLERIKDNAENSRIMNQ